MQQGQGSIDALVEAFLIVDQPRQRLGHWAHALSPLDDYAAPPLALVRAFWDPTTDQALINLAYDPIALGDSRLHYVVEIALLAELGMIQPAELSRGDRQRFLDERLARCTLRVDTMRDVVGSLTELVRRIREVKTPSGRMSQLARGDTQDPVMLVKAKGTRDDLPPQPKPEPARVHTGRVTASPHVVQRSHRAQTVSMPPDEIERHVSESMSMPALAESSSPRLPTQAPATIYARYLRSGRWVPIRVGALSLKGAALMTGALPRMHDNVDVALSFGGHRALVRGSVGRVSSTAEATAVGASSFNVNFELDDGSRRQLTALLTAARAAKITIKPAPPRTARRFPVEWAVALQTPKGVVRAEALDVSRDGLFVRPHHALALGALLGFTSTLDDGNAPIAGRAKVVRHVSEHEARTCGHAAGFGLHVEDMTDADRMRWLAFIDRIERRSEKRVLVGASASRLADIQDGLAAAGYAVTGATDYAGLAQLVKQSERPDAVILDTGWSDAAALLETRHVPWVTLDGDARRARGVVDQLLIVS